jgi:beta-galactosidase
MWLLGNENNYGLEWKSAETENLPLASATPPRRATCIRSSARSFARSRRDPSAPVAMANGDLQYIDIIAAETKGLDVFGTNVYRGISFGDLFQVREGQARAAR